MSIRKYKNITPTLGQRVYIDEDASVIGDVHLGDDSSVWPQTTIRGDVHKIRIGARTNIQDGTVCHVTHPSQWEPEGFGLTIGDDVTVGHKALLHACTVGNRVLVGMGSIVLDGAVIEDDVILGAGSLVLTGKTLESGYLYAGSPAKQKRKLSDEELEFLKYSAEHYVRLKDSYL